MKTTFIVLSLALFNSFSAKADFTYYPLICEFTGANGGVFTSAATFTNKVVTINGANETIPVVTAMVIEIHGIPCSWETGVRGAAPGGTAIPPTLGAIATSWTLQSTVLYGNGSTVGGGSVYLPSGWAVPLHKKFRILVTPDAGWNGHIKNDTLPVLL